MGARLGIDVGGTFTDVVVIHDSGRTLVEKVLSTPEDASIGILRGIEQIKRTRGIDVTELSVFAHGSTVATNALLESKLPRTALIVTRGFRDVLEIGTQLRTDLFDLGAKKSQPYVPRELVFEVEERVDRLGQVVTPLSEESIALVVEQVRASGVEAVGIALLFSFRNGEHEEMIARKIRSAIPGLSVAVSSDVAPEIGEYPRASTTVVSAALQPLVARYMAGILEGLEVVGVAAPVFVMQSNGGTMTAEEASPNAHRMVLSGPAAGVLAATQIADKSTYANLITFDMGGTSTDIALIEGGRAALDRETTFEGRPLLVPQFAIHTIGSGGGSLAHVDETGLLRVGPESAGALPGPACYGRGGTRPTTTDAQLVLGRIDPAQFLGGEMSLDLDAAQLAIQKHIADPLGMDLAEAAAGILAVADAIMARGARVVSVNRGHDPRDFLLLPFGGAGPMHALSIGAIVEVGGVLVPVNPGTFSAVGLAGSDIKYDFFTRVDIGVENTTPEEIEATCSQLIQGAESRLIRAGASKTRFLRIARFRYAWQDHDVEVVIGDIPVDSEELTAAIAKFHERHLFEFGHSDSSEKVELVSIGIEAQGLLDRPRTVSRVRPIDRLVTTSTTRPVYFQEIGWHDTPIFQRSSLAPGDVFLGPAIVEEREATTILIPETSGRVDADGNLILLYLSGDSRNSEFDE
jgi:N-methylhydantoinase A